MLQTNRWRALGATAAPILLLLTVAGGTARAMPVAASGATEIQVTSFDTLTDGLGLDVGIIGLATGRAELEQSAFLPSPIVRYAVSAVDPVAVQIFHEGVGLELSAGSASVRLENFIVDGDDGVILADVMTALSGVSVMDFEVFQLDDCAALGGCVGLDDTITVDGLQLRLTQGAIDAALVPEFGAAALGDVSTETPIGVANSTFLLEAPEPGVLGLLALAGLGVSLRRRGA